MLGIDAQGPASRHLQYLYHIAQVAAYILAAAVMFGTWLFSRSINGRDCATFVEMVYGRACKPFVYRALLPALVRLTTALLPAGLTVYLDQSLAQQASVAALFAKLQFERQYFTEYLIGLSLMYASLLGFMSALRCLFNSIYRTTSGWFRDALPVVTLVSLRYLIRYVSYVYDLSTVFLFTLGLALMQRGKWRSFLLPNRSHQHSLQSIPKFGQAQPFPARAGLCACRGPVHGPLLVVAQQLCQPQWADTLYK